MDARLRTHLSIKLLSDVANAVDFLAILDVVRVGGTVRWMVNLAADALQNSLLLF